MTQHEEWVQECLCWRGVELKGVFAHYCHDWDGLPMDETCVEFPCACFRSRWERLKWRVHYVFWWWNR
jgi:hypothetical protein